MSRVISRGANNHSVNPFARREKGGMRVWTQPEASPAKAQSLADFRQLYRDITVRISPYFGAAPGCAPGCGDATGCAGPLPWPKKRKKSPVGAPTKVVLSPPRPSRIACIER